MNDWRMDATVVRLRELAMATLRQELPENLEWIPWQSMPRLRWREDSAVADERVVRGWLVAAALRDEPTPGETLTRHAACFNADDAALLATWLLDAWIDHDTSPPPKLTDDRRAALRDIAARGAELAVRLGRESTDPEARYRALVEVENNRLAPSAQPHRGLLAIVAACANGDKVARIRRAVERYQATWSATRPAQCRALANMLSSIDREIDVTTEACRDYST